MTINSSLCNAKKLNYHNILISRLPLLSRSMDKNINEKLKYSLA